VTIGGTTAALFYVSPTQINAVVDPATPTGSKPVVITSSAGTQNGTVTIDTNAAPGLFSLFGTGTRDGAILNAITFLLGDFSTRTANSPTYLALFATGLNPSVTPTVTVGGVPVTVAFFGAAPCCDGLQQINIQLPDSLSGAGRVPVVVSQNGQTSNTVQVILLPPAGTQFGSDQDNQTRNREIASIAYVPNSSLVLVTDEHDDVVRVIDVKAKQVTHVISLPSGAHPTAVAVNAGATEAVVAETGKNKAAVLDLTKFAVTTEIAVGQAPAGVAIGGTQAVVVNQDDDTVSVIDLTNNSVQKTIPVGRGPVGVAVDATAKLAYVTNEDDGTVSVIDLAGLTVTKTFTLGASMRVESITLIPGAGSALVTVPAAGPDGMVILLNLATGATSSFNANPERSGGTTDAAYFNSKVYFANQAGGTVSVLPVNPTSWGATGGITTVKVDLGARALAIDPKDNLLVVSNEGSGTLVLVDLNTLKVTARISAVQTGMPGDDDNDDHSDHNAASNSPAIQSISPASGKAGATITLTITGTNLTGATGVIFSANGQGNDKGSAGDFTVSHIQVNSGGTQLTAAVAIASSAKPGARSVQVMTPNGESPNHGQGAGAFVVMP
jgi:uncharacterized protein (TIGR03437 family)